MFFLSYCCQSPFPCWNHSSPNLPRMPSNTVLISGPAPGAAQILICAYSCVLVSNVHRYQSWSIFLLWALSMAFYIFHRHRVCLVDPCGFNLKLVQLVGRFWVFFLSYIAPGFQLWFNFHLYMCSSTGVCS